MLTAERLNGKPVYAKEGDADRWLFARKDGKWGAGASTDELTENDENAGWAITETCLAHPAAAKAWKVWDGSKWVAQPVGISIMVRHNSSSIIHMIHQAQCIAIGLG